MPKRGISLRGSPHAILLSAVRIARPQGAWLATASRSALGIVATWGSRVPEAHAFEISHVPLLRRMRRSRRLVTSLKDDQDWERLPHALGRTSTYWACFPLVTEGRVVGALALWGKKRLSGRQERRMEQLARQTAQTLGLALNLIEALTQPKSGWEGTRATSPVGPVEQDAGGRTTEQPVQSPAVLERAAENRSEDRLAQASKLIAVGEMAAGIAHELNNPLTTVTGFAELVLDEIPPDAPFRADVEMVLHEAQRARSVVRRLLDFARQGEGARSRADIGEIVDDVLALTTHFIHTSGVQLEVVRGIDLPWILMDSNQMKQVLLNIIHNAIQAMPAGGRLKIHTEVLKSDARSWVVVHVADTGLGIRPNDLERIFEPFFTTRANRGGTGLGLSVSYGIVADHGGRIEVESQPGVGSTFSVWLPA